MHSCRFTKITIRFCIFTVVNYLWLSTLPYFHFITVPLLDRLLFCLLAFEWIHTVCANLSLLDFNYEAFASIVVLYFLSGLSFF